MNPSTPNKLCLGCAIAKLTRQEPEPGGCKKCYRLNLDPLAKTRANAAKPFPLMLPAMQPLEASSLAGVGVLSDGRNVLNWSPL